MKNTIALLVLVLSLSAMAQNQVELKDKKVSVSSSSAIVVRTNNTPETVEIEFQVPMANQVCERYETRYVMRTSSFHCGENIHTRRILVGRVCVRTNDNNKCVHWENQWRTETYRSPRTCMVPETYCARYGTAYSTKSDTMKIKFKDLPALGDSESETFSIEADQKSYNSGSVVYIVKPLNTLQEYKVKQNKFIGLFKTDSYEIRVK